jgi:hypothetical protein
MKKLWAGFVMAMPLWLYAGQAEPPITDNSMISQPLVAEGTFALKLVSSLGLGTAATEEQAEDILAAAGIIPKNGWIANYPMTPMVIGEVRDSILTEAAANRLPLEESEALKIFRDVTGEFGLAVLPVSGQNSGQVPGRDIPPDEIDNYYNQEGPPVVSYYPPPEDYSYLYVWVPYPFFGQGFFFPGFFILNDFALFKDGRSQGHFFTNHFVNPKTHAVVRVGPAISVINAEFGRGILNRSMVAEGSRSAGGPTFVQPQTGGEKTQSFRGAPLGTGRSFATPSGRSITRQGSFGGFHGGGFGGLHGGGEGGRR